MQRRVWITPDNLSKSWKHNPAGKALKFQTAATSVVVLDRPGGSGHKGHVGSGTIEYDMILWRVLFVCKSTKFIHEDNACCVTICDHECIE